MNETDDSVARFTLGEAQRQTSDPDERAVDRLISVRRIVLSATKDVDDVERHIREVIRGPNRTQAVADFLRHRVREAPLLMVGLAFAIGATLARR